MLIPWFEKIAEYFLCVHNLLVFWVASFCQTQNGVFMFIRNLISQLISTYEIDFSSFIKSRTEEVTTIRYAVITAMCDYFTDIEISKSTELCRSAVNKIRNHHRYRLVSCFQQYILQDCRKRLKSLLNE